MSEEATALMEQLLAEHYINGGVPLPIVELVEETLRRVGPWFVTHRAASTTQSRDTCRAEKGRGVRKSRTLPALRAESCKTPGSVEDGLSSTEPDFLQDSARGAGSPGPKCLTFWLTF